MNVPGAGAPGALPGAPVEVAADAAAPGWAAMVAGLRAHGTAVVYGGLAGWSPEPAGGAALRTLLGRDWLRYAQLSHSTVRNRFAASRRLLKSAAAVALDTVPGELELSYGPTGRPSVRGRHGLDVSLSHAGNLLLVGLTTRGLIGVDAEPADRALYGRRLERRVCTPGERRDLGLLPDAERNAGLVRLWTLKEAYSKAVGEGLGLRFSELGFEVAGDSVRLHRPDGGPGADGAWSFGTYAVHAAGTAYRLGVAVRDTGPAGCGGAQ